MFSLKNRKMKGDRGGPRNDELASTIQTIAIVQTDHKRRGAAIHLERCTSLDRLAPCLVVAEMILPENPELGQIASCVAHIWQSVGEQLGHRFAVSVSVTDLEIRQLTRALEGEEYYGIGWKGGFYLPTERGPERLEFRRWEQSQWYTLAVRGTELHDSDYFLTS